MPGGGRSQPVAVRGVFPVDNANVHAVMALDAGKNAAEMGAARAAHHVAYTKNMHNNPHSAAARQQKIKCR